MEFLISFWSPYFRGKSPPVVSVVCGVTEWSVYTVRCTVTQLLRLEEFNPVSTEPWLLWTPLVVVVFPQHFVEESGGLWEKHCLRDFKGCQPQSHQSWRELYLVSPSVEPLSAIMVVCDTCVLA